MRTYIVAVRHVLSPIVALVAMTVSPSLALASGAGDAAGASGSPTASAASDTAGSDHAATTLGRGGHPTVNVHTTPDTGSGITSSRATPPTRSTIRTGPSHNGHHISASHAFRHHH